MENKEESFGSVKNDPFVFTWKIKGFDIPLNLKSIPFDTCLNSRWHMELDLTQSPNLIRGRLQRAEGFGPAQVRLNVKLNASVEYLGGAQKKGKMAISEFDRLFDEGQDNSWGFVLQLPRDFITPTLDDPQLVLECKLIRSADTDTRLPPEVVCSKEDVQENRPGRDAQTWASTEASEVWLEDLKQLYKYHPFHDLVLRCSDREFQVHKAILHARLPNLLSLTEKFKIPNDGVEIRAVDIQPDVMLRLLTWVYNGEAKFLHDIPSMDEHIRLIDTVSLYNLHPLFDKLLGLAKSVLADTLIQSFRQDVIFILEDVKEDNPKVPFDYRMWKITLQPGGSSDTHNYDCELECTVVKGRLGFNWLKYSLSVEGLPLQNPLHLDCKVYAFRNTGEPILMHQEVGKFDEKPVCTEDSTKVKHSKSSEIITWSELIDEKSGFLHDRKVEEYTKGHAVTEKVMKEIHLKFDIKVSDGVHSSGSETVLAERKLSDPLSELVKAYHAMMLDSSHKDCTLVGGGVKLDAHKCIVAVRCPMFREVLSEDKARNTIEVDASEDVLKDLVHYMYTGEVAHINHEKCGALKSLAAKCGLQQLKDLIEEHQDKTGQGMRSPQKSSLDVPEKDKKVLSPLKSPPQEKATKSNEACEVPQRKRPPSEEKENVVALKKPRE